MRNIQSERYCSRDKHNEFWWSLGIGLKTTGKKVCFDGEADDGEEGQLMNSNDEVVA